MNDDGTFDMNSGNAPSWTLKIDGKLLDVSRVLYLWWMIIDRNLIIETTYPNWSQIHILLPCYWCRAWSWSQIVSWRKCHRGKNTRIEWYIRILILVDSGTNNQTLQNTMALKSHAEEMLMWMHVSSLILNTFHKGSRSALCCQKQWIWQLAISLISWWHCGHISR